MAKRKVEQEKPVVITSLKNAEKGLTTWHNDLVEGISKFNLKPTQLKLVMLLSSKIKKDDEQIPPVFNFRTSELVKVMGFTGNNGYHLKKLLEEMRGKTIRLQRRSGWSVFGWIVSADVYPLKPPPVGVKEVGGVVKDIVSGCTGETKEIKEYRAKMEKEFLSGTTTIKLDERIAPFLIALAGNFTEVEIKYILGFEHASSPKLYILLKRFKDTGQRVDDEWELREKLCDGEYKDWVDFKRRVLKPALAEINKTDIRVSYTKIGSEIHWTIDEAAAEPEPEPVSRWNTSAAKKAAKKAKYLKDIETIEAAKQAAKDEMERYALEMWESLDPADREERIASEKNQNRIPLPDIFQQTDEEAAIGTFKLKLERDDRYYQKLIRQSMGLFD